MTDHPVIPIQYLPVCAAIAVKEGMDEMEALKAITINAAEITGIAHRVVVWRRAKMQILCSTINPLDIRTNTNMYS